MIGTYLSKKRSIVAVFIFVMSVFLQISAIYLRNWSIVLSSLSWSAFLTSSLFTLSANLACSVSVVSKRLRKPSSSILWDYELSVSNETLIELDAYSVTIFSCVPDSWTSLWSTVSISFSLYSIMSFEFDFYQASILS